MAFPVWDKPSNWTVFTTPPDQQIVTIVSIGTPFQDEGDDTTWHLRIRVRGDNFGTTLVTSRAEDQAIYFDDFNAGTKTTQVTVI